MTFQNTKGIPFWMKAVGIVCLLAAAWTVGNRCQTADLTPVYQRLYGGADNFEPSGPVVNAMRDGETLGLLAQGQAVGYGGTLQLVVAADSSGRVRKVEVVRHAETPAFLYRVNRDPRFRALRNKSIADAWTAGQDLDIVSGATYTSKAYIEASRMACQKLANVLYGTPIPKPSSAPWGFDLAEMLLITLFGMGLLARGPLKKQAKLLRWASMLAGLAGLGFWLNRPLTLGWISRLLMGQFPALPGHLYWYLLIGGIVLLTLIEGFNPYCDWFCPFGAAQECLAQVGRSKKRLSRRVDRMLRTGQALVALGAIALALILRNPTATSYEIFGTLFRRIGSPWQFALLGVVLVVSLFWRRPWCAYLCPLRPVTNALKTTRQAVFKSGKSPEPPR